jgi:hypothetical protein
MPKVKKEEFERLISPLVAEFNSHPQLFYPIHILFWFLEDFSAVIELSSDKFPACIN